MWDTNGALIQTIATHITVKTRNYPIGISSENHALQMNKQLVEWQALQPRFRSAQSLLIFSHFLQLSRNLLSWLFTFKTDQRCKSELISSLSNNLLYSYIQLAFNVYLMNVRLKPWTSSLLISPVYSFHSVSLLESL